MKIERHDEHIDWLRFAPPALAWAALFAFFAFAGAMSPREEPRQAASRIAGVAVSTVDESDGVVVATAIVPRASDALQRDPAIVAHEVLDPVGVGSSAGRTP